MKHPFRYWLGTILLSVGVAAHANVTASLDQNQIDAGDTVQLTLQRDASGGGNPDLGPLKKDFDILGTSTATNIQYINGQMSQQHQLALTLSPKHSGTIEIPALTWAGEQTAALQLTVGGSSNASGGHAGQGADSQDSAGSSSHVFLTTTLDTASPYVQGTALLTVRLHTDQVLQQAGLDMPGNADVTVQPIGKDQQSSENRNGHRYEVIERQYLLLPQRSGSVTLDGPTLEAQVSDTRSRNPFNDDDSFLRGTPFAGILGGLRPLRLHGDPIRLDVQPRPPAVTGASWLPAKQLTVEQDRTPASGKLRAGEPLSLHLKLQATGLTASQLPDLSRLLIMPDGLKAYPDQAKLDTRIQGGALVATRDQDIALIANRAGQFTFQPVRISWWDTTQNTARELSLQIAPLDIAAGADGGTTASQPASAATSEQNSTSITAPVSAEKDSLAAIHLGDKTPNHQGPWVWVSVAFAMLWLMTMGLLWHVKRRPSRNASTPETPKKSPPTLASNTAQSDFHQACKENRPHPARRHLLSWAAQVWPSHPPRGLETIATVIDDPGLTKLLDQLDRACFIGGEWVGEALSAKLRTLPRETKKSPDSDAPLPKSLYF